MSLDDKDITIIGGGIIGLSIAYYLSRSGRKNITIIEKGKVASEASYTNAGGIWPNRSIEPYGIRELASFSLRLFQDLVAQDKLEFEFRVNGVIELVYRKEDVAGRLTQIEEAKKAGYQVSFLETKKALELEPEISQEIEGVLYSPHDANANCSLLSSELTARLQRRGVTILENVEVEWIDAVDRRITKLGTSKDVFSPELVINSAGPWSPSIGEMLNLKIPVKPAKGYILSAAKAETFKITSAVSDGDVVVTQQPDGRTLVGGTVDFLGYDKTVNEKKVKEIMSKASRMVPRVSDLKIPDERTALRPH